MSGSEITPCIKIDKPLVAYKFWGNVTYLTIGITHVILCINICRVPRKLFEQVNVRPSVQILSEGLYKC